MNKKLLLSGIVRTLTRYKLRTFFMSLGIVLGVATLVVTRTLGVGTEQARLDEIARMFSASSLVVSAGGGTTLEIADLEAVADALDEVAAWDPVQTMGGQDVRYKGRGRQVTVLGHSEQAEAVWNRGVVTGEFFTADDVRTAARVALLGPKTAEALFGDEDPVGRQIRVGTVPLLVRGVLESYGVDPHGMDRDDEVHVPITTLMRRLRNVEYIRYAKLIVDDPRRVEETADRVAAILRQRHAVAPGEPDDFSLITPALVRDMVDQANRVFDVFLPAAAAVVLLVAAIVIANLMLIGVRERVAEVGLRKAVGATERQVGVQFLTEAVAVTLVSGLVGVGLGVAVTTVVSSHIRIGPGVPADAIVLGLAAASIVGVLAGVLPARRAARLDPVEALR